jgi:O-acetylserine/cysteine efflux transporter
MNWQDRLIALAIVAVWGFNFVVIKWGVAGVPPFLLGALRFSAAAGLGLHQRLPGQLGRPRCRRRCPGA